MKRGQSGLSLLLAIDKPVGLSSHDVVNAARRAIGERRVGHAGTLDPLASGVLLLMAGPAARLDGYLTGHDKEYIATIAFGASTSTDDCTGSLSEEGPLSARIMDEAFAQELLEGFLGSSMQMPPAYSAIKVNGKKSYEEARRGKVVKLSPRSIDVRRADLLEIGTFSDEMVEEIRSLARLSSRSDEVDEFLFDAYGSFAYWKVRFDVSKGTYIRSLARDIGKKANCPAHLAALERTKSGNVSLAECLPANMLEKDWRRACADPVRALGYKVVFPYKAQAQDIANGKAVTLFDGQLLKISRERSACECMAPLVECKIDLQDKERVSMVVDNSLKAIYEFDAEKGSLVPSCVFNIGVDRGYIA